MQKKQGHKLPLMLRIRQMPGRSPEEALLEQVDLLEKLMPYAAGFYVDVLDKLWSLEETAKILMDICEKAKSLNPLMPIFDMMCR